MDRLLHVLLEAAEGRFPTADGALEVVPAPSGARAAVVAFTAHSIVAADLPSPQIVARLTDPDPGAPMSPTFLAWLAERVRSPAGSLDVVLVGSPADDGPRLERIDPPSLARVDRALDRRTAVEVYADADRRGIVTVGRGLAGRREVSLELDTAARGHGRGTRLARAARRFATAGDPLFAQVAPGNAASLRAFLAAGYRPIGSEVLFTD